MLDRRAQILLKTLVERYIAEGEPVGSRSLSRFSGLDLSPATIRNVMADLEELGFVASPHTSAGRVPTARGYRFFVDTLLTEKTYSPSELTTAANFLNQNYAGLTFEEIHRRVHDELKQLREDMIQLMTAALEAGSAALSESTENYVIAGERNLLDSHDLASNMSRLRELFELFERKTLLMQILELSTRAQGVQLFIGGESGIATLDECSVVTAPYEVDGKVVGTVGVIGPTHMAYERVIPIVDITAKLLSSALSQH